jgi:Putative transmembrane protein (PGPGW)
MTLDRRPRPLVARVLIVLGGFGLVALGGLLLVLPGPGLLVLAAGLGLLSLEFRWAARLRRAVVARMQRVTPRKRSNRLAGLAAVMAVAIAATLLALFLAPGFLP